MDPVPPIDEDFLTVPDVPLAHCDEFESAVESSTCSNESAPVSIILPFNSMSNGNKLSRKDNPADDDSDSTRDKNFPTKLSKTGPSTHGKKKVAINSQAGSLSGSLHDLVQSFDQKVNVALKDTRIPVEKLVPREPSSSREKIKSERQLWHTLSENCDNLAPIDFERTSIRLEQIKALDSLRNNRTKFEDGTRGLFIEDQGQNCLTEEDEKTLRRLLDLHRMSESEELGRLRAAHRTTLDHPPQSADQVIEEIDEMLAMSDSISPAEFLANLSSRGHNESFAPVSTLSSTLDESLADSLYSSIRTPYSSSSGGGQIQTSRKDSSSVMTMSSSRFSSLTTGTTSAYNPEYDDFKQRHNAALRLTPDELNALPQSKLLTLCAEMEQLIQEDNTELVSALAARDEQAYERELKHTFISLVVSIQEARRKQQRCGRVGTTGISPSGDGPAGSEIGPEGGNGGQNRRRSLRSLVTGSVVGGLVAAASGTTSAGNQTDPQMFSQQPSQLLTATIPIDSDSAQCSPPTPLMLEALNKVLQAIADDSPQVPSLLTSYILNGL